MCSSDLFDSDSNERSSSLAPLLIEENEPLRQRQENALLQIAVNATRAIEKVSFGFVCRREVHVITRGRAKLTIKKGACQVSVYLVREDYPEKKMIKGYK